MQQKCANILLIEFGNAGRLNYSLQSARPRDVLPLHRVVEWTHAGKVACEDGGAIGVVTDDKAPISNQMDKAADSPSLIDGERDVGVAGVSAK